MTQEMRLLQQIGEVDEQHVAFAQGACPASVRRHSAALRWIAVAACLAVLLTGIVLKIRPSSETSTDDGEITLPEFVAGQVGMQMATTMYTHYVDLARDADAIVCADVVQEYREETEKGYLIYAKIKVRETLKGDVQAGDTLLVEDTAGGRKDEQGQYQIVSLYGDPLLEKGNRVLLFLLKLQELHESENGQVSYALFGSVGKFFYDADGKYHWSMLYNGKYPKDYKPSMMMWDPEPKSLKEIRELIRDPHAIVIDETTSFFTSMSRSPCAGEVVFRPYFKGLLNELRTKHDQFLISFYVYDQHGNHLSQKKTMEECVRLASLGYRIYQKPSTQYQCDHEIVGVFTFEELCGFVANDEQDFGTSIVCKLNEDILNKDYGYCFGDIWNSSKDVVSKMDEDLRIKGEG